MNDKKNAIKRLQSASRSIKYTALDLKEINIGSPQEYLKLYHYLLLDYNVLIAAEIVHKQNMELSLKNDMVFISSVYKLCRDMLNYIPKLTKDQFFSSGFAQAKALMACDIIELLQDKVKSLQQQQQAHHGQTNGAAVASASAHSIHQLLGSKHSTQPTEASIQRSASLRFTRSAPPTKPLTKVTNNMLERETMAAADVKPEIRRPPAPQQQQSSGYHHSLARNPPPLKSTSPVLPRHHHHQDDQQQQVDEEQQFQSVFLTLTSKMTDLSSKLNGLLNRVDCLESNMPPLTTLSQQTFEETGQEDQERKSDENKMIEKIADDVSKLTRLFENLSNRMVLLETEVLLIRQGRNEGVNNNQADDSNNSSANFETPFNSFLNISHTDKTATTGSKQKRSLAETYLNTEHEHRLLFDDLTINSTDTTPKILQDVRVAAAAAPVARAQNLVNMASQISQMLSSGSKVY